MALAGFAFVPENAEARRYSAIVVDAPTGSVLHESRADRKIYPASLTKMMTVYMLFEAIDQRRLRWTSRLRVSARAARQRWDASKIGLKPGQTISSRDAALALIVKSAADASVVVAETLAGSEKAFARAMTAKARQLGMRNTEFRNASGMPNRRQVSTARDMATLARALLYDFPHYYPLFATQEFRFRGKRYKSHNRLLKRYKGVDGIKTGYIKASGYNIVASAVRNGRRVIAVVIGGKKAATRDRQVIRLLDRFWGKLPRVQMASAKQRGWQTRVRPTMTKQQRMERLAIALPVHKPERATPSKPAATDYTISS